MLPRPEGPPSLIFIGNMGYRPNEDAILYFCKEILPIVRQRLPDVELWIVGTNPPPSVQALAGPGVHVTGRVPDVREFYERCTVSIVPLRSGSGTRLKILEAMALGRPVVSTSIGCEGLEVVDRRHLMVADAPAGFAQRTIELLENEETRSLMVDDARELAVKRYDWDVIAGDLAEHLQSLVDRPLPGERTAGQTARS